MDMMFWSMLALLCFVIGAPLVYIFVRAWRMEHQSKAAVKRLEAHPQEVEMAVLVDEDPLRLSVQFRGGMLVPLYTIRGVAAVRMFDHIAVIAPQAVRQMTRGGKQVKL